MVELYAVHSGLFLMQPVSYVSVAMALLRCIAVAFVFCVRAGKSLVEEEDTEVSEGFLVHSDRRRTAGVTRGGWAMGDVVSKRVLRCVTRTVLLLQARMPEYVKTSNARCADYTPQGAGAGSGAAVGCKRCGAARGSGHG